MTQREFDLYGIFTGQIREFERWTYEDAKAAEHEWIERTGQEGPGTGRAGVSPVHQWFSWTKELPRLRTQYETTGDFKIIFEAVTECINARLPLPPWCAVPLRGAWNKIDGFEHRSWDDVFGRPHPGINLHDAKRWLTIKTGAVLLALDRIDQGDEVIRTLKKVATDHGLSYEQMREWYYAHRELYPITETLMSDGWYYRKKTGEPDSGACK